MLFNFLITTLTTKAKDESLKVFLILLFSNRHCFSLFLLNTFIIVIIIIIIKQIMLACLKNIYYETKTIRERIL